MANRGQGRSGGTRSAGGQRRREVDNQGILPVLARGVREVEAAVQRGRGTSIRSRYQAIALLVREERQRVKADAEVSEGQRAELLKRLDGVATILAKTAAREPHLFDLLAEDAVPSDEVRMLKREMTQAAGLEAAPEPEPAAPEETARTERRVLPQSVVARQLANPFMPPDFSAPPPPTPQTQRLSTWELIGPLLSAFERASAGTAACMELPEPRSAMTPGGVPLMHHQAEVVQAAMDGHRTFLLADEPGLGKTAQSLLAAHAADAYPMLAVVPNVVKANWAREAEIWTPRRTATVIHGNGDDIDGFADIVIVNYEVLDRHVGWLGDLGFRSMVLDEAHFIKNKSSQRSQHVLQVADRIRQRVARPLMLALTGTPLINEIEDFRAIWEFLGWIDEKQPRAQLMAALEETGLTPLDPGFYPAARKSVIDLGIVRRRKIDVASDIPDRRIADIPVELEGEAARSIRDTQRELVRRLVSRYDHAVAARTEKPEGIDEQIVEHVAMLIRDETPADDAENVFTMMRRIGQAKSALAADYAVQLARQAGKVVFFAKHIDVMDTAQEVFEQRGLRYSTVRGNQTSAARQASIDAFVNDPDVKVIVCSLSAAGVGLNLQVASNLVLAELSWTYAEQTQAIDRVHRIGQDEPVTAWRIIGAQTIDTSIARLIDRKAGLAARALDGDDEDTTSADLQLETLTALLTQALEARG
ncbi:MAG: DEAD/DEAH box helicase [Aeromicrobium sp.]|uniref:DEAD/DEAH box helicase n=1 Tax=Aeromicrobium sp. TaxID=1871063 RepID=UPI0026037211|nr:DEAD/DEAH box helicase [Aeromicrobium sp.]MDF1705086.1 DEAD/DEAH box helicase [Aeromicrobium sp.]